MDQIYGYIVLVTDGGWAYYEDKCYMAWQVQIQGKGG